jgi:hypothetical protein
MTTLQHWLNHLRRTSALLTLAFVAATQGQSADLPALEKQGVVYKNDRKPEGPWSIHYVKIDRSRPDLELTTSKAGGRVIGLATLSEQVNALPPEAGRPLVAINGDFFQTDNSPYRGDPRGLMIVRGELISAPSSNTVFWVDADRQPHIEEVISEFKVTWPDGKKTPIGLNEARAVNAAVLYTPSLGRSTLTRGGRELILERDGTGGWLPLEVGRTYLARVREVSETNNTVLAKDTLVLSLGPQLLEQLPEVKAGDVLKISTATLPFLKDVKTAIGGGPKLVRPGHASGEAGQSGAQCFLRRARALRAAPALGHRLQQDTFVFARSGRTPAGAFDGYDAGGNGGLSREARLHRSDEP